jgi:hypothetical protein
MCGRWEIQADGDVVRKLVTRVHGTAPMPIALAAFAT